MGFPDEKFVQSRIKFSRLDLFIISLSLKFNKTKPFAINQFIGHSISLFNNVVTDDHAQCVKYLRKLERLNPSLYQIVSEFDDEWDSCSDLNLLEIFSEFEKRLNDWLITNKIFS